LEQLLDNSLKRLALIATPIGKQNDNINRTNLAFRYIFSALDIVVVVVVAACRLVTKLYAN